MTYARSCDRVLQTGRSVRIGIRNSFLDRRSAKWIVNCSVIACTLLVLAIFTKILANSLHDLGLAAIAAILLVSAMLSFLGLLPLQALDISLFEISLRKRLQRKLDQADLTLSQIAALCAPRDIRSAAADVHATITQAKVVQVSTLILALDVESRLLMQGSNAWITIAVAAAALFAMTACSCWIDERKRDLKILSAALESFEQRGKYSPN